PTARPCRRCSASTCAPRSFAARWRRRATTSRRSAAPVSSVCPSSTRRSRSMFAYVDALGLYYGKKLLDEIFGRKSREHDHHESAGLSAAESQARTPRITSRVGGLLITTDERCALA